MPYFVSAIFFTAARRVALTSAMAYTIADMHVAVAEMKMELRSLVLLVRTDDGWKVFAAINAPLEAAEEEEPEEAAG